jgi:hypothetical protein
MNIKRTTNGELLRTLALSLAVVCISIIFPGNSPAQTPATTKPSTNINDVQRYPRNENSMPGKFPGKVIQVNHTNSVVDNKIVYEAAYEMIAKGMLALTGKQNLKDAWKYFFNERDRIGLKINPVAGPTLSTSVEVTEAIIKQLQEAGIPKENIVIWDRREQQIFEAGFTKEKFPGIKLIGTERADEKGSMYDADGKLYGEKMIDKDWYYWADCEERYDTETIPYMVNEGKYSYFSKIVTQMVDKIINIPILKNAGATVTLCLKNLAYGSISNTGRLHKQLWAETCAEVSAFPPLRDKVVLNIVDGIKGCFNGGPAANPQFFTDFKTILIGTDPVAVDRIGHEIVVKKRIDEKIQKEDSPRSRTFLDLAQNLKLGIADLDKIILEKIDIR